MLRLTPELESLHQCHPAELVTAERQCPPQKHRDNESTKGTDCGEPARAGRACGAAPVLVAHWSLLVRALGLGNGPVMSSGRVC